MMRVRILAVLASVAAACLSVPSAGFAEGLTISTSSRSRDALFRSQTRLLDTRLAVQYEDSVRLRPNAAKVQPDAAVPGYSGRYRGQYLDVAKAAAARHAVPEDLFLRLVQQESGWNPSAKSVKGATGLAQLMPGTAQVLGVDPGDPAQNLEGGARYLRQMYDRFGSWRLALAAYNAGPEAVDKYDGVPPYQETKNYVLSIYGS
jgi:soluble lytic murein transglycosylase-like protein